MKRENMGIKNYLRKGEKKPQKIEKEKITIKKRERESGGKKRKKRKQRKNSKNNISEKKEGKRSTEI